MSKGRWKNSPQQVLRFMQAAGLQIDRIEIAPDGKIVHIPAGRHQRSPRLLLYRRRRYYFRRRGFKKVALPGLPGSQEFMAAYQAALAQRLDIGECLPVAITHDEASATVFDAPRRREVAVGHRG
jgi:hypothetical protein